MEGNATPMTLKTLSVMDLNGLHVTTRQFPIVIHSGTGDHPQVSHLKGYRMDYIARRRDPATPGWEGEWIFSSQFREGNHGPSTQVLVLDFEVEPSTPLPVPEIHTPSAIICQYETSSFVCTREAHTEFAGQARCKVHARSQQCLRDQHVHCHTPECECFCHDPHKP